MQDSRSRDQNTLRRPHSFIHFSLAVQVELVTVDTFSVDLDSRS